MSHQNVTWGSAQRTGDPVLKGLLLAICNYAASDRCWVSQKRISFDTEIPERSLRRKLTELVNLGLIQIEEQRREDGTRDNNIIRLLTDIEYDQPATVAGGHQRPKRGVTSGQKGGSPAATMVASVKNLDNNNKQEDLDSMPTPVPDDGWPDDFLDQFWKAFPPYRREGRRKVGEKLARLRRDKVVAWTELIGAVLRFAATNPGEYAPAPMVWLNGERWDREYGPAQATGGLNGKTFGNAIGGFCGLAARLRQKIADDERADAGDAAAGGEPFHRG